VRVGIGIVEHHALGGARGEDRVADPAQRDHGIRFEAQRLPQATGEVEVVPASDLGLGFRTSVLKHHYGEVPRRSGVIVSITLELREVGHGEVPTSVSTISWPYAPTFWMGAAPALPGMPLIASMPARPSATA
jgi:hypothetical protein